MDDADRRKRLQADNAGQIVMAWIMTESTRTRVEEALNDRNHRATILPLVQDITWLVIGAGDIDLLWSWLHTDDELLRELSGREVQQNYLWKGHVFSCMCLAFMDWDHEGCANSALECFSVLATVSARYLFTLPKASRPRHDIPRSRLFFSLVPASVNITNRLRGGQYSNTDPSLYDNFVHLSASFANDIYRDFNTARLLLWHPNGPEAQPVLNLYKGISADPDHKLRTVAHHYGDGSAGLMFETAAYASAILKQDGYHEDGNWLVDFARKTWPRSHEATQQSELLGSSPSAPTRKDVKRRPMPTFGQSSSDSTGSHGAPAW